MIRPRAYTRTRRREYRRWVRGHLGVSREDPPTVMDVLRAADALDQLLRLTTNGRMSLSITDRQAEDNPVSIDAARTTAHAEGYEDW